MQCRYASWFHKSFSKILDLIWNQFIFRRCRFGDSSIDINCKDGTQSSNDRSWKNVVKVVPVVSCPCSCDCGCEPKEHSKDKDSPHSEVPDRFAIHQKRNAIKNKPQRNHQTRKWLRWVSRGKTRLRLIFFFFCSVDIS